MADRLPSERSPSAPPLEGPSAPAPPNLARSAGLIGLATMASRVLGVVREQVLAYLFGAGNAMDAFNVAFRIPNLVRDLFAEGAMSAAFVPTFTRRVTLEGKERAWDLGNQVINALLIVTGVLVVAGVVFATPLVGLYAGNYAQVPGKLELTVRLARVMLPFLTLVAIAAAFMGMLNSLRVFFVPALAPAMFNVATILCAFALVPFMPALGLDPIMAIAFSTLVGGFGQAALQWPLLKREGFRYRPVLNFRDPGLREVLVLMGPGTIGLAAVQINFFVNTVLATGQGTGAVSWLNYAFRLMYLPIGIFGVSIATAALPAISEHAARKDLAGMRQTVANGLCLMLALNVPATVGLIVLASPIVALIFERGRFTPADTAATAAALMFYAPGLLGYSSVKIAVPTFYALRESRTPVYVSAFSVLLNATLNMALVRVLGYQGLALGTAVAAMVNSVVLLWLLRGRLGGLDGRRIAVVLGKTLVASLLMAWAVHATEGWLEQMVPGHRTFDRLLQVGISISAGLVVLGVGVRVLGIKEFDAAIALVRSRLKRASGRPA